MVTSLQPIPRVAAVRRAGPLPLQLAWIVLASSALVGGLALGAANTAGSHRTEVVSGGPEPKLSTSGRPRRWHQPDLVLHLDDSLEQLGPGTTSAAVQALAAWSDAGAEHLPQVEVRPTHEASHGAESDGINAIVYAPVDLPGHDSDLAVTIVSTDEYSGAILEADVILNSRYRFAVVADEGSVGDSHAAKDGPGEAGGEKLSKKCCRTEFDLQATLTHEAGHLFGLGEDRDDEQASMYFRTKSCDTSSRSLSESDAAALQELYSTDQELPQAACSVGNPSPRSRGSHVVLAVLIALSLVRRLK